MSEKTKKFATNDDSILINLTEHSGERICICHAF